MASCKRAPTYHSQPFLNEPTMLNTIANYNKLHLADYRPSGPEWHIWQHTPLTAKSDRLHLPDDEEKRGQAWHASPFTRTTMPLRKHPYQSQVECNSIKIVKTIPTMAMKKWRELLSSILGSGLIHIAWCSTFHGGEKKGMYHVVLLCTWGTRYVVCEYHSKEYAQWEKKQWALEGEIEYDSTVRSFFG